METKLEVILQKDTLYTIFRPTLDVFANRAQIASAIEDCYAEWQANTHGDIILYSPLKKSLLEVTAGRFVSISESEEGKSDLENNFKTVWQNTCKMSALKKIINLGFRTSMMCGTKFSFEELVKVLFDKFQNSDKAFRSWVSGENVTDTVFVIDQKDGDVVQHVQIGPVQKNEITKIFRPNFKISDDVQFPDACIYLEVSISRANETKVENVVASLEGFRTQANGLKERYIDYIKK